MLRLRVELAEGAAGKKLAHGGHHVDEVEVAIRDQPVQQVGLSAATSRFDFPAASSYTGPNSGPRNRMVTSLGGSIATKAAPSTS